MKKRNLILIISVFSLSFFFIGTSFAKADSKTLTRKDKLQEEIDALLN